MWRAGLVDYRRRPTWLAGAFFAILAFVTVHATVVFPQGTIRWVGGAVTTGLIVMAFSRLRSGGRSLLVQRSGRFTGGGPPGR